MKIYIDTPFQAPVKAMLHAGTKGDELVFKDEIEDESVQLNALLYADILFGNPLPVERLQQATNLKWVQLASTGFEYYSGIKTPALVTNLNDYYAQPCAETVVAGIMSLYRGIDRFSVLKNEAHWVGYPMRAGLQLLKHKKVIILGSGNIARQVAKILSGFDCGITFFARTAPDAILRTPEQLVGALPKADIVIACLPGTTQTKGLFTTAMIQNMKESALFCNIGRGNLLEDEGALVDALMNKKIGGAVLDVTATEPLPREHALWKCPNTILSQHTGGGNITEQEGIALFFLDNLSSFKKGYALKNVIQLEKGY